MNGFTGQTPLPRSKVMNNIIINHAVQGRSKFVGE